jgi:hypothetical protein
MRSILVFSSFLLSAFFPALLQADVVVTQDATKFGAVLSFDGTGVSVRTGCNGNQTALIAWSEILLVTLDAKCEAHPVEINPAGLQRCEQKRIGGFRVRFRNLSQPFFAVKATLQATGKIFLLSMTDESGLSGPRDDVESVQPIDVCPKSLPAKQVWPKSFCHEPKKIAVNWSPGPVFNNHIFTKGGAIYIDVIGELGGLSPEDILFAYQTALSLWTYALQDRRSSLPLELQKYIDQSTSRSASVSLFTPPQVVRVDCMDNALSVVKWYSQRANVFPLEASDYVAMAQVQGRTVLLNANDNAFVVSREYWKPLAADKVSLLTVFIHELGHSFGLPDKPHSSGASVMDPDYVVRNLNATVSPTAEDAAALVGVLKESIEGSAPGIFNAKGCLGLRRKRT